jgi:acetoin utilization deacetylase AcuC-like enzyme
MSDDDLVKRLRGSVTENLQARIEALERERDELQKDFDGLDAASRTLINEARSIAEAAEARLAKAVEALRLYACACDGGFCHANENFCGWTATAVLADIKGGKKDE